jgi:hypothetical protein
VAIDARAKLFSRREAGDALVFVGEAGSVSGQIWLENRESSEIELRVASLHSPHVRPAELTRTGGIARIPVPKLLRGHQRELVSFAFDLDPSTPPGKYEASLVVEGAEGTTTFPAEIIVTQDYSLTIDPDEFVVTAVPGGEFTGEVVVENDGNVPIEVFPLGEFRLEDPSREPQCCCCCGDEIDTDEEDDESDDEPEFGVVVIDNERTTVEPATSATIRFVGRLSDDAPANMLLRAKPRIGIERFTLDVITPPGGAAPPSESGRRSPQKRKRS